MANETGSSSPSQNSPEPRGLLRILVSVFSGVLFGVFLSRLHSPDDEGGKTIPPQNTPDEERRHRPLELPASSRIGPAPAQENDSNGSTDHSWLRKDFPQIVIAMATIGLLVLNYFALKATQKSAKAAVENADLARKQMETLKGAVVQIPDIVVMQFPVPPFGEARVPMRNTGQVNAHDIHIKISVKLKRITEPSERPLASGDETVKTLGPSDGRSFIYPFVLSDVEYRDVMNTRSYLEAQGFFDYENGFQPVGKQPFCYAYIWGSQKFGRWSGECGQLATQIQLARKLAKQ